MESNDKLKEGDTRKRTRYYFDGIIRIEGFGFGNILVDEISFENVLVYNISNETLIGTKLLRIRFYKVDGFIRVCDGKRLLVLSGLGKYDAF